MANKNEFLKCIHGYVTLKVKVTLSSYFDQI